MPQWIVIEFVEPQTVNGFSFQFQGGFAAKEAKIQIYKFIEENGNNDASRLLYEEPFYADDINAEQKFSLKTQQTNVKKLKFIIESSTDFFGRIIVYNFRIF